MSGPTRKVLYQYGFRINETGVERWGHFDKTYDGANSTTRARMIESAEEAVSLAANVGVTVTYTILRRGYLTTTWSRWLRVEEVAR